MSNVLAQPNTEDVTGYIDKPDIPLSQHTFMLLRSQNVPVPIAAEQVGWTAQYGYQIDKRLRGDNKPSITDSKFVNAAHKSLGKLIKGKAFGDIKEIKDSTTLQAINTVLDRTEPIRKGTESPLSGCNFTQINIHPRENCQINNTNQRKVIQDVADATKCNIAIPEVEE
jgi:hypothetical protein